MSEYMFVLVGGRITGQSNFNGAWNIIANWNVLARATSSQMSGMWDGKGACDLLNKKLNVTGSTVKSILCYYTMYIISWTALPHDNVPDACCRGRKHNAVFCGWQLFNCLPVNVRMDTPFVAIFRFHGYRKGVILPSQWYRHVLIQFPIHQVFAESKP